MMHISLTEPAIVSLKEYVAAAIAYDAALDAAPGGDLAGTTDAYYFAVIQPAASRFQEAADNLHPSAKEWANS